MHTSVLNSRVILIVRKRVQQRVLDSWRRKGLRGNNRWRLRTKCISQENSSVTWANTMPTLVINCRVVLIYSIARLICHDEIVYEEIIFCKTSLCIKSIDHSFTKNRTCTKLTWATIKPFTKWTLNLVWGIFPFIYLSVSLSWTYVNEIDVK